MQTVEQSLKIEYSCGEFRLGEGGILRQIYSPGVVVDNEVAQQIGAAVIESFSQFQNCLSDGENNGQMAGFQL